MRLAWSTLTAGALLLASAEARAVEPWSDPDPGTPPVRNAVGDYGWRGGVEYRAVGLYVNPIALNSPNDRTASWFEHRLRLDGTIDYKDKIRAVASADVLDGVLWGDNGTLGTDPQPNSGTNVAAKSPNVTRACVTLQGGDPLDRNSYGYGLCPANVVNVRRLYGEVMTPVGMLRIGRQPFAVGNGLQGNDGDGRRNRWGFARSGQYVDRILFATKPLEGLKPKEERDLSPDNGVFFITAYDRIVEDSPQLFGDNLHQALLALRYADASTSTEAMGYWVHRWDQQYATSINTLGVRLWRRFGDLYTGVETAANIGSTQEVSVAYKAINNDPVVDQKVSQLGARAVARYDQPMWTAYLEADYASGTDDPQPRKPLSAFLWSEDSNVGLLLFKHVLAFQTARAAAAGVETLRRLNAVSFPAESINTRGAFTNALAIFPQFDFRPVPTVLLRGGVMMAWAPARVIDPVASLLRRDGVVIDDDLVNYVGGSPGKSSGFLRAYYGTELDGRFQWRFEEHFAFDLEGAILFPGDALQDANGTAVRSVLLQGRTTFFF